MTHLQYVGNNGAYKVFIDVRKPITTVNSTTKERTTHGFTIKPHPQSEFRRLSHLAPSKWVIFAEEIDHVFVLYPDSEEGGVVMLPGCSVIACLQPGDIVPVVGYESEKLLNENELKVLSGEIAISELIEKRLKAYNEWLKLLVGRYVVN